MDQKDAYSPKEVRQIIDLHEEIDMLYRQVTAITHSILYRRDDDGPGATFTHKKCLRLIAEIPENVRNNYLENVQRSSTQYLAGESREI